MVNIIGVRFRQAGKIYYFDPGDLDISMGQHVIVETARGVEYGTVCIPPRDLDDSLVVQPLKKVIRIADEEDDRINEDNHKKSKEAYRICLEKISKFGLKMKLIDTEYTFDNNKILFYFTADGRIDFRELVKDLASVFKTRIELRQIGVRDETKMLGGIGICGRPLCCYSYMSDFVPVSIKMAKEQSLSLNPAKISGVCGRLMCCLKYEQETYEWLNSKLPNVGDVVTTDDGIQGVVDSVNVMRQRVKIIITDENDEKEAREYSVDRLQFHKGRRRDRKADGQSGRARGSDSRSHDNEDQPRRRENAGGRRHENDAADGEGEHRSHKSRKRSGRRRRPAGEAGRENRPAAEAGRENRPAAEESRGNGPAAGKGGEKGAEQKE